MKTSLIVTILCRPPADSIETLIDEYFDILPIEKTLIDDTVQVIIPSVRPSRARSGHSYDQTKHRRSSRTEYVKRLCDTLNGWAKSWPVHRSRACGGFDDSSGLALQFCKKSVPERQHLDAAEDLSDLLAALDRLREDHVTKTQHSRIDPRSEGF